MASPSSSRMMAGSEISNGSSLMSLLLHTGGKYAHLPSLPAFYKQPSEDRDFPSSILCSTFLRTALNLTPSRP